MFSEFEYSKRRLLINAAFIFYIIASGCGKIKINMQKTVIKILICQCPSKDKQQ